MDRPYTGKCFRHGLPGRFWMPGTDDEPSGGRWWGCARCGSDAEEKRLHLVPSHESTSHQVTARHSWAVPSASFNGKHARRAHRAAERIRRHGYRGTAISSQRLHAEMTEFLRDHDVSSAHHDRIRALFIDLVLRCGVKGHNKDAMRVIAVYLAVGSVLGRTVEELCAWSPPLTPKHFWALMHKHVMKKTSYSPPANVVGYGYIVRTFARLRCPDPALSHKAWQLFRRIHKDADMAMHRPKHVAEACCWSVLKSSASHRDKAVKTRFVSVTDVSLSTLSKIAKKIC